MGCTSSYSDSGWEVQLVNVKFSPNIGPQSSPWVQSRVQSPGYPIRFTFSIYQIADLVKKWYNAILYYVHSAYGRTWPSHDVIWHAQPSNPSRGGFRGTGNEIKHMTESNVATCYFSHRFCRIVLLMGDTANLLWRRYHEQFCPLPIQAFLMSTCRDL